MPTAPRRMHWLVAGGAAAFILALAVVYAILQEEIQILFLGVFAAGLLLAANWLRPWLRSLPAPGRKP